MTQKTVAIVTSGLALGGSEVQVVYLAAGLKDAGWRVSVVSLQAGPLELNLKGLDIPVVVSPMGRLATPHAWLKLLGALRTSAPDLIHTQAVRANLWGRLASMWAHVPVVASVRATYSYLPRAYYPVERLLSYRTAAIVTPSRTTAQYLIARVGIRSDLVEVIPNGVDVNQFGTQRRGLGLRRKWAEDDDFLVLAPGRLVPQKNHDHIIRAFARMSLEQPKSVLVIAGSGPLEPELRRQAGKLRARVLFVGELGRIEIAEAIGIADVVCLTSKFEGMPNVLLEAMASAKPVVATRVGGTEEIVENGREGFLVPTDDDVGLAAHLGTLARDPGLRHEMGDAGRLRVLRDHRVETNINRHLRLYERVLAEQDSAANSFSVTKS